MPDSKALLCICRLSFRVQQQHVTAARTTSAPKPLPCQKPPQWIAAQPSCLLQAAAADTSLQQVSNKASRMPLQGSQLQLIAAFTAAAAARLDRRRLSTSSSTATCRLLPDHPLAICLLSGKPPASSRACPGLAAVCSKWMTAPATQPHNRQNARTATQHPMMSMMTMMTMMAMLEACCRPCHLASFQCLLSAAAAAAAVVLQQQQ